MNTKIINFTATFILALALSFVLPWWSVMIAGFVPAVFLPLKRAAVFFIPFLAVLIFWSGYAFIMSNANDFILAKRIAVLLPLNGNPYVLILVTGIIGGLGAGAAGVFGKQLNTVLKK